LKTIWFDLSSLATFSITNSIQVGCAYFWGTPFNLQKQFVNRFLAPATIQPVFSGTRGFLTKMTDVLLTRTKPPSAGDKSVTAASNAVAKSTRSVFHADRTINHSYYQRTEVKDTAIPQHIRQLILDSTSEAQKNYAPDKILARNDSKFLSKSQRTTYSEKAEHNRIVVQTTGFSSDIKEPYKPLGEPILDSQQLLLTAVKTTAPVPDP
jgi:hypothetical protein